MSMHFNNLLPAWLTLLLAGALLAAIGYGVFALLQRAVSRNLVVTLSLLRLGAFVLFLMILLQPAFTYTSHIAQLPEMVVLVDTSPSMGQAGNQGTRLDEATAILNRGELASSLQDRYRTHWFVFNRTATPIEVAELPALKPGGAGTQYADSIEAALTQARALGKKPQRLLLVSDGLDRGQGDPVEVARQYGLTVDVLAPSAKASSEGAPIEIIEVQSARRVLLASDTIFRVTLHSKQPANVDRQALVRVVEDGKKRVEQEVTLKAGRVEENLEIVLKPTTAGLKKYDFSLAAGAARPYPVAVQVVDSKYEVLIIEDRWRWEYKYLHRLFEDDPSFRFWALLNRGGAFQRFGSPDSRVSLVGFPQNRADLEGFDTFVLGDVDPAKWPRDLAADLAHLVADEGRSLVVIAGPNLAKLIDVSSLHTILPVELSPDSGKPIEGPIDVRLRGDAADSAFFFQLRSADAEKLTPLDQVYPTVRKRPGATVLVEAVKHRNAYGNAIVIAEHTVGRGRVLFLGTDTFWKWHTLAATSDGPTPYSIFWQQAFRAMTPTRSNTGPANLWLTPSRSRAEVGQRVTLRAEAQSNRPLKAAQVQGFVTTPDDQRLPLVFVADASNPRLHRAEFVCTKAGVLKLSATLSAEGKLLTEATTSILAEAARGEEGDVDLTALARIANDTGGKIVDPALPESWPTAGDALPVIPRTHTIDPWSNFTLILLLCTALGADWFIRLFKGLVSG